MAVDLTQRLQFSLVRCTVTNSSRHLFSLHWQLGGHNLPPLVLPPLTSLILIFWLHNSEFYLDMAEMPEDVPHGRPRRPWSSPDPNMMVPYPSREGHSSHPVHHPEPSSSSSSRRKNEPYFHSRHHLNPASAHYGHPFPTEELPRTSPPSSDKPPAHGYMPSQVIAQYNNSKGNNNNNNINNPSPQKKKKYEWIDVSMHLSLFNNKQEKGCPCEL